MPRPRSPARLRLRKRAGQADVYMLVWHDGHRRCERSTGTADRRTAEAILAEHIASTHTIERRRRPPEFVAIADCLTLYGEEAAGRVVDRARIGQTIGHLAPWWGARNADDVTPQSCAAYTSHRRLHRAADGTIGRELTTLAAALNHAVKAGMLTVAPSVAKPQAPPPRDRWLTRSEAAQLLRAARAGRARHLVLFILLALYTGARRDDILALRWAHVDLQANLIDFRATSDRRTKKRRVAVPIGRRLSRFLRAAHKRAEALAGHQDVRLQFVVTSTGAQVGSVKTAWRYAVARAGLTDVTPHTLRHTCATWLCRAGVDIWQVAGMLGNSVEMVAQVYGHHHPDHLRSAASALDRRAR